jgi:uncharacterized protein YndB with AHSA1/START domain
MTAGTFDSGPLADVECVRADDDHWTLTFARELPHPPERVWGALTARDELAGWAPFVADRDLDACGSAVLTMIDGETSVDRASEVRRADAPRLLEYTWDSDILRWELDDTAAGTRLTLHHTMSDRDAVPMVAAGWHLCFVVVARLLDGDPIGPIRGRDAMDYGWEGLRDAYARALGIGAG